MESALVRGRSATNLPSLGRLEVAGGAIHALAWPQLAAQLQSCASLHSLRLCNCPGLTDTLLASVLLPSCPRLRSLTLTRLRLRAPSIESPTLCALTLSECEELTSPRVACDRLHTLCFSGSDRLVDPHVASADLEALDLSGCPQLAAPRLECLSLRVLDLSACTALRAESVQAQVDASPKLRTLRLSGCRGLRELSLASPSIVTLHACWCTHLRTVTLQCPALQSLHTYGCGKLAQADVRAGSPTRFELQKCGAVDDALLAALTAAPRAARLELLNLTDCKALRAPRLVCARLRTLHLYNCLSLSALTLYCPALELLNLTHCAELAAIDLSCPKLATLLCAGCKRLPDAAMVHAIRTCGALRTVDTKACPLLSDATRAVVEELLQKPAADVMRRGPMRRVRGRRHLAKGASSTRTVRGPRRLRNEWHGYSAS